MVRRMKFPLIKILIDEGLVSEALQSVLFWLNHIIKLYLLEVSIDSLIQMGQILTPPGLKSPSTCDLHQSL